MFYHFRTLNVDDAIQLAVHHYNHTPHSGIYNITPILAHFSTHQAGVISKLNDITQRHHQLTSMRIHTKKPPHELFKIGDTVKTLVKRSIFRKHQPLKNSIWSESIHKITNIDKTTFPYTYSISEANKKFYSFQLLKITQYYPLEENISHTRPSVLVDDYHIPVNQYLRSGKATSRIEEPVYRVLYQGKVQNMQKTGLLKLKQSLGTHALAYSSKFSHEPHTKYVI